VSSRFTRYIGRLLRIGLVLSVLFLGLYAAQSYYHVFDDQVAWFRNAMVELERSLSVEALAGISMGSLVLVAGLCLAPIFWKKIDTRGYMRGLWRGVVSAFVFLASSQLFAFAARASKVYLIAAIAGVIVVSALLIEAVSLAVREAEERSLRTDIVSSISSGLLFGVLVQLGQVGLEWAGHLVRG
jgi:glucan phosphoethanolaminetransferase (alkaline phosphatase superfamily)